MIPTGRNTTLSATCNGGLAPRGRTETIPYGAAAVTGVCGFIGSHLALALLKQGITVIGVDKRPPHQAGRAAGRLRHLLDHPAFHMLTASVDDAEVARHLTPDSTVFHLAAATDVAASWGVGFADHATSVLTTQRLLDVCRRQGVRRVVVASSSHVYGAARGRACA